MSEMLGNQYFLARKYSLAAEQLEKALFNDPGSKGIRRKLVVCYTQTGDIDKALQLFLSLIKEDIDFVITMGFKDAVSYLESEMGPDIDDWAWGDLHTLNIYHPFGKKSALMGKLFNIGPLPMGGSLFTVNPATYRLTDPWEVYHGASLRYIIDLSDMNNSKMVTPNGISGNFMSPHYDDQTELWIDYKYRPFVLSREGVDEDARYTLELKPKE